MGLALPLLPGGHRAGEVLGLDGGLSPRVQRTACRRAADRSFDRTAEHLRGRSA